MGFAGLGLFAGGLILCVISIIQFARPEHSGLNRTGLYRFLWCLQFSKFLFTFLFFLKKDGVKINLMKFMMCILKMLAGI